MVVIVGYCNDGWIVVWTVLSVADVIRKIFFIHKFCGGFCVVAIGGGVNVGCGGSSLAHHHHQQQHHHHLHHNLNNHLHHNLNHTAYT